MSHSLSHQSSQVVVAIAVLRERYLEFDAEELLAQFYERKQSKTASSVFERTPAESKGQINGFEK